jgi:hypothetical protein
MSEFRGREAIVADLITGVLIAALGVATIALSAAMPTFEEQGANPLTAPGIFPALIGLCFVVSGAILAIRSRARLRPATAVNDGSSPFSLPVLGGFALMLATVALVGRVDIHLLGAGFSLVFCAFFVRWDRRRLPAQLAGVAITTLIAAVGIPIAFEDLFLVRLP